MQQEFAFVYQDLKVQLKEIPSLPLLLKSIEKTTKKLDCINLYSLVDKRQFDFQLFQKETFDEIYDLLAQISDLEKRSNEGQLNMEALLDVEHRMDAIKEGKIEAFDKLNKLEEFLQVQIQSLIDPLSLSNPPNLENQIKQVEQDEDEVAQDLNKFQFNQQNRHQVLKKQIDEINTKISRINRGKGKWFDGDHNDFLKLYNRLGGDAKKIVEQGVKMLGMKNIEIMDHLEVYQNYLQLQKQKKLATEEFKSIKLLEQQSKNQLELQQQLMKQQKQRMKKKTKEEENYIKKVQIQQFKRKKAEQKEKLVKQLQKERLNEKKQSKQSVQKKKEIEERNKKIIFERQQSFKQKSSTNSNSKEKPKSSIINFNELNNLKVNKTTKPPLLPPSIKKQQSK